MKIRSHLIPFVFLLWFAQQASAQIPVTDVANLANNTILHVESIAKWIESIAQLKTQIDQLNQQIALTSDIRTWSGNPVDAGAKVVLNGLGVGDLLTTFGQTRPTILSQTNSLDSIGQTASGSYRAISSIDLDGNELKRDPLTFRRYSILDAQQANAAQVRTDVTMREADLQTEIALTLDDIKAAPTEAEVQKLSAKLAALNGQLIQVETQRRREVDEVALTKIANDARLEEERLAAAELAAKDDYLANQRVSVYMKTLKFREKMP
ncbi:MAG: type IV secretion system protein [Opitutus sp.]